MEILSSLPQHVQQKLQNELHPGESLVWVGHPDANKMAKSGFLLWFLFLPWMAFSLYWTAKATGFKIPDLETVGYTLFGLPFVLVGLAGLSIPFLQKRKAASTIYAITNRRAFSIEGAKSITVKTYIGAHITHMKKTEHQDGSGDLILHTEHYLDSDGDKQTRREGFFAVANVRNVERMLGTLIHCSAARL